MIEGLVSDAAWPAEEINPSKKNNPWSTVAPVSRRAGLALPLGGVGAAALASPPPRSAPLAAPAGAEDE